MSKLFRVFVFLFLVTFLFASLSLTSAADFVASPSVSAQSAVLIEAQSGRVIYQKNANLRLPMASTTKIMTAIAAARLAPFDTQICIDARMVGVEGSSIYLAEGEILTLEELLYALLLESANDAAVAIAIGLSGSVEAFCEEMNREAARLGLADTHFTNPHGLDDEEHYTTAMELALVARALLSNPKLAAIVATQKIRITTADPAHTRVLSNHNRLLRAYTGCIGVKTGYTKRSGRCLVSAAEREGVRLIAVTLNAPNDWQDHSAMLDYGFEQLRSVLLCAKEEYQIEVPIVGGECAALLVSNPTPLSVTLPKKPIAVKATVELPRFLYAPVQKGDVVGKVVYQAASDGNGNFAVLGEVELLATDFAQTPPQKSFWQRIVDFFRNLFTFN